MISDHDRSGWFGASDTAQIMGSWETASFAKWWAEKIGFIHRGFTTPSMRTGTAYEHRILNAIGVRRRDRQIRIPRLRLRVNLDGEDRIIHEVKTHGKQFNVTKNYWMQCQVEMFAAMKPCEITAYRLGEEEYRNYFLPIDDARITRHGIRFEPDWVLNEYLPRLRELRQCLKKGEKPNEASVQKPTDPCCRKRYHIDRIRVALAAKLIERSAGRYVSGH